MVFLPILGLPLALTEEFKLQVIPETDLGVQWIVNWGPMSGWLSGKCWNEWAWPLGYYGKIIEIFTLIPTSFPFLFPCVFYLLFLIVPIVRLIKK